MKLTLDEITVETLDRVAEQWEEDRIIGLVRSEAMSLGDEFRRARYLHYETEMRVKIRAMKLFYQFDFTKKEIAELFGVETREVGKWLKQRSQ